MKLFGMIKNNTKQFKVKTPTGYQNFDGIRKLRKPVYRILTNAEYIDVTFDHPFVVKGNIILARDLHCGDILETPDKFRTVQECKYLGEQDVYDLLNVKDGNIYYCNNVLIHNCFLNSGESALGVQLYEKLKVESEDPAFIFDEGHYLVWEEPDDEGIYVAGVDVAEGVGEDASVIQILDIRDLRNITQVAQYHCNTINPISFTQKLYEILSQWGSPPALIERNNCGAQVVDQLAHTYHYRNIVTYGINSKKAQFKRQGMQAHTNTKYAAVTNMRYWVGEVLACKIRDIHTLKELRTFVRYPNGTWAAESGADKHDDRVMSLLWGLMILHDDIISGYLEVLERDTNHKPLAVRAMDYGLKTFQNPASIYSNLKDGDGINADPVTFFSGESQMQDDVGDLMMNGWQLLG